MESNNEFFDLYYPEEPDSWVTVYTGASHGSDERYSHAVQEFACEVVRRNLGIVFGAGKVGLMGELATTALNAGGQVIGISPRFLVENEIPHDGLTRLEIVETMSERKLRMGALGDAFVVLPGGAGTLEEFFEVWTWQQLGIHTKPVGILNSYGYWDELITMIDHMVEKDFLSQEFRDSLIVTDSPQELLDSLLKWEAPKPRWS